jgi:hydrogenase maturation protease
MSQGWAEIERPGPQAVVVNGVELRRGSRVRTYPRSSTDILDTMLAGRVCVVESLHQDLDDNIQIAVVAEDDPGRDLGNARQPGHRFFFSTDEVEPLDSAGDTAARILVAGIGNIFLADDAFGVELANRLTQRALPACVDVCDFGIRGMDLAYALQDGYHAVVFLDASPRGDAPGTLYVIEPELADENLAPDAHGMDPARVIALARSLGELPQRILVLGCEPQHVMSGDEADLVEGLSSPVQAALDRAVPMVESLLQDLVAQIQDKEAID